MNSTSFFLRFMMLLSALLLVSFIVHYLILQNALAVLEPKLLIATYLALFVLTILIVGAIQKLQKNYFNQVGFLFLVGSMIKFALYFVILKPFYQHFELSKSNAFLVFFIPYLISLISEAVYVSKLLNSSDPKL